MQTTNDTTFLRQVLLVDAATSGAMGMLLLLCAGLIERWLALPAPLLRGAGLILLPFAALVAFLAIRPHMPAPAVWAVILINLAWTAESTVLALGGWVQPTVLGQAFVLVQAVAVAGFAAAEYAGLRRPVASAA